MNSYCSFATYVQEFLAISQKRFIFKNFGITSFMSIKLINSAVVATDIKLITKYSQNILLFFFLIRVYLYNDDKGRFFFFWTSKFFLRLGKLCY